GLQIVLDVLALAGAYGAAFLIRFEGDVPLQMLKRLGFTWPYVVALQFVVLTAFGVRRFAWRFVGLREVYRIAIALVSAAAMLATIRAIAQLAVASVPHAQYGILPWSVVVLDLVLAFLGVTALRVLRRSQAERTQRRAQG